MYKKITDFLRDQIWQSIGAVIALIGIFVAYNIFFLQSPKKTLDVYITTNTSLISVNPEIADKIEINYQENIAKNVYLLEFQVRNTGNQPITSSDFETPIIFSVSPDYIIAEGGVPSTNPSGIDVKITPADSLHEAELSPTLLNPNDSITVRFVLVSRTVTNGNIDFQVKGRIVGVKQIEIVEASAQNTTVTIEFLGFSIPVEVAKNNLAWISALTAVIVSILSSLFKEAVMKIMPKEPKEK